MSSKVSIHGHEVELQDELLGVHYWAQHYRSRVPCMEVFEYIGQNAEKRLFFFISRTENNIIIKTWDELVVQTDFRAFLIDPQKLEVTLRKFEES